MNRENLRRLKIIILTYFTLLLGISVIHIDSNNFIKTDAKDSLKMTYAEVGENENSTESEYVKFDAYFLGQEGESANKVRGTEKELNDTDELYLELNVLTNGYLENGKITLTSGNYKIAREISSDNEISWANHNTINFNNIQNGTYKTIPILIEQNVIDMGEFITYNKDNLTKENTVVFTGTHIAEDGTRTDIEKEVKFNIDWYGSKNLNRMKSELKTYVADNKSDKVIIVFQTEMYAQNPADNDIQVPDKAAVLEGIMPLLNGYAPTSVNVIDVSNTEKSLTYTYDINTRKLEVRDEIIYNNGQAELSVYDERYKIKVTLEYPYIAYSSLGASTSSMNIKVHGYLEGYNNPNTEFINPMKSSTGTQLVNVDLKNPKGDVIIYDADIDLLSKTNLRLMYDRNIDTNNGYRVLWRANINLENGIQGLIFEEDYTSSLGNIESDYNYNIDQIQDSNGNFYSLEGINSYTGIKVPYTSFDVLGDDGYIQIIDEATQNTIATITKGDADKYISYEEEYSHIKIKTSKIMTTRKCRNI